MVYRKALTVIITVLSSALLASCGSSSSSPSASGNSTTSVHGIYYGVLSVNSGNKPGKNLAGGVGPGGKGYFFSSGTHSSNVMVFSSISDPGQVSSSMTDFPSADVGGTPSNANWNVTITEDPSMMEMMDMMGMMMMMGMGSNLPFADIAGNGVDGTNPSNMNVAYQTFSDSGLSLASIAGSYQGSDITRVTGASISVSSSGAISGTDGLGCTISGSLTQESGKDLFQVNMSIAGSAACAGSMTGVAFVTADDLSGVFSGAAGSYLYLISANNGMTDASTLEVKLQ
jgi:hypothetical protein